MLRIKARLVGNDLVLAKAQHRVVTFGTLPAGGILGTRHGAALALQRIAIFTPVDLVPECPEPPE